MSIMKYEASFVFFLACWGLWLQGASGTLGIDVSVSTSVNAFECLKQDGYQFVIVRAYRSSGQPDGAASQTISNARKAGFEFVDVYLFPCPKCSKSASTQVNEMGEFVV